MKAYDSAFTPLQRFWRLLKPDQKEIVNIYVLAIFSGLINLSLPLGIQAIINLIQGGRMSTSLVVLIAFVISGVAFTGILQIFQLRITENLQQKIFTRAAFEFSFRLPRIKAEALYRHYAPELMNRFFDTVSIQKGLSKILIDFSTALLQGVFGLILLSFYHPFFIAFSIGLALLAYVIFALTFKSGMRTSLAESAKKYQVAHWLEEIARNISIFKMTRDSDLSLTRTNELTQKYLKNRESHFKVLLRQFSFMVLFKVLVATGLLIIGSLLVMDQQMNIGQFVAAEIIILLVMTSIEKLIMAMETIYDVLTSLEKVGQVTDLELEKLSSESDLKADLSGPMAIDVSECSYRYPGNRQETLKNISLNIKAGERIMLTGNGETGKSTLLKLIAGLFDPTEGSIAYNGLTTGNLNMKLLRARIGSYFHDNDIFEGTLLENITMGRNEVSFEDAQWACKSVGLAEFIRQLPEGYNTIMDPEGRRLPKSIAQKLMVARSIAHRPKLLLLKNPFRYLSFSESSLLNDFLTDPQHGWTVIIASTDHQYAKVFDRIIYLKDGQLEAFGTYSELKNLLTEKPEDHA